MSLFDLPDEVWLQVLSCSHMHFRSIGQFSKCCRRSRLLAQCNLVWHQQFKLCFAVSEQTVLDLWEPEAEVDWRQAYRLLHGTRAQADLTLRSLSRDYICRPTVFVAYNRIKVILSGWRLSAGGLESQIRLPLVQSVLIDYLRSLIHDQQPFVLKQSTNTDRRHANLTNKLYARQCVRWLVHQRTKHTIREWLNSDVKDLAAGLCLFEQWFRPSHSLGRNALQDEVLVLVQAVKEQLALKHADHPLLRPQSLLNRHKSLLATDDRAVLNAIRAVFRSKGLVGDTANDEHDHVHRLCIMKVLETKEGRPITLCCLAYLVAQQVQLDLQLVNFPGRIMLRFDANPELSSDEERYSYLDVWDEFTERDEGRLWSWYSVWSGERERKRDYLVVATPQDIMHRLANNAGVAQHDSYTPAVTATEYMLLFSTDWRMRKHLAQLYVDGLHTNRDIAVELMRDCPNENGGCPFMSSLQHYKHQLQRDLERLGVEAPTDNLDIKMRAENVNVSHSVGQIMLHKVYNYHCVIVGWDGECTASIEWQKQMGVHQLVRGGKQPFYNVLCDDGSTRYAADDNLVGERNPQPIAHAQVGKYFDRYLGTHYGCNADLRFLYPEDSQSCASYVKALGVYSTAHLQPAASHQGEHLV